MTDGESIHEERPELLTLWRLRTPGASIHIEDQTTTTGVVFLCEEEISSRVDALTSRQPEARVRNPYAPMCAGCLVALDQQDQPAPDLRETDMSKHNEMVVKYANGKTVRTRIDNSHESQLKVYRARTRADVVEVDVQTVKTPKRRK